MLQEIAEQQAKVGDSVGAARTFQEAIKAAKAIRVGGLDPLTQSRTTLIGIAGAQAAAGNGKAARETIDAIEGLGAVNREVALLEVALGQARSGDVEGALKTLRNDHVLTVVAKAQARMGRLKEAARTVEAIENDEQRVEALTALAAAQFKTSDKPASRKTFEQCLKIAARVGQHAYVGIVKTQVGMGNIKAARETADDIITEPWRSKALLAIQLRAGDFKAALQTVQGIENWFEKGEALQEIVTGQLRAGDLQGGFATADSVKELYWRVVTLATVAKAQAKAGDRAVSAETFKRAFALLKDVPDKAPGTGNLRNAAAASIAQAQAEAGDQTEREAVAWAMKQSPLSKTQSLLSIAQGIVSRREPLGRP
jgi:tetratricopeptide (TPR) repeat protein